MDSFDHKFELINCAMRNKVNLRLFCYRVLDFLSQRDKASHAELHKHHMITFIPLLITEATKGWHLIQLQLDAVVQYISKAKDFSCNSPNCKYHILETFGVLLET